MYFRQSFCEIELNAMATSVQASEEAPTFSTSAKVAKGAPISLLGTYHCNLMFFYTISHAILGPDPS